MKALPAVSASSPCPLCASTAAVVVGRRDRHLRKLTNLLCLGCGLVRIDPLPSAEAIADYYRHSYREQYHGAARPSRKALLRDERGARERLGWLKRWLRPGARLLDVGAGSGAFVACAREAGFDAVGIEPHRGYCEFAREHYGLELVPALIAEARLPAAHFDLITSVHVFEHLPDPLTALARIRRWLRPDGLLHLAVPDAADPQRTPLARFHAAHVLGFTGQSLEMLVRKAGWRCVEPVLQQPLPMLYARPDPDAVEHWQLHLDLPQTMQRFYAERTLTRHLCSATPYRKFVARMLRFARERWALARP